MSYILEALKKLEQKSQRGGAPKLLSFPGEMAPKHKKKPLWLYILIAALLLNAGAMFWLIGGRGQDQRNSATKAPAIDPSISMAPAEPNVESKQQYQTSDVKNPPQAKEISRSPDRATRKEDKQVASLGPKETPATASGTAQPHTRTEKRVVPSGRVLSLDELPPAVRSHLPEFKVSGHAYSPSPELRVARVNNQILQEGQNLSPGLKVEEITPGGIIFGYQGYRFQVGINAN